MTLAAPVTTEPGACGGDPTTIGQIRFDDHGRRLRHGCPDPICAHDGKDTRDHGVRMWDALVEACRRLQATDNLPHTHATSARITLTMSYEDLRDRLDTEGLLPSRETLSAAVVRRLACDARIETQQDESSPRARTVTARYALAQALGLLDVHQTPWQVAIDPTTRRPVWIPHHPSTTPAGSPTHQPDHRSSPSCARIACAARRG